MKILVVIPARYGSSRFAGKPMAMIAGKSMLERVWHLSHKVTGVSQVIIATEDERIITHAKTFGATAVLTPENCRNGTERCYAILQQLPSNEQPDAIINFQGDAVLTPPWILQALVDALQTVKGTAIVTPAMQLSWEKLNALLEAKKKTPASGTFVTFDKTYHALYFSKNLIPFLRTVDKTTAPPVYRHIGLYGYTRPALEKFLTLPPSLLEETEGLEQLRALENGIPIKVALTDYRNRTPWSIDSPEDIAIAEELIAREGEL